MKTLALDIETSPNIVYTWGLFDQNIGLNQIVKTTDVICFAARWIGNDKGSYLGQRTKQGTVFFSTFEHGTRGMLEAMHTLLDEAHVVLHYNGSTFDMPHLQREFLEAGMPPPSPYAEIDLYRVVKRQFRFQSKKLEHVSTRLGLEGKIAHEGFNLWRKVMAGEASAWKTMEQYNRQDVVLLEELYDILLPWIPNHPSVPLHDGLADGACPRCGSVHVQSRGVARTKVSVFQQYQCMACKGWFRGAQRMSKVAREL